MDFIQFHINWKNYVRNRLHELLNRLGVENVFKPLKYDNREITVAGFISDLDYTLQSFFNSIENFALKIPMEEQQFPMHALERIPVDQGADVFGNILYGHYREIIAFLRGLKEEDLSKPLNHPILKGDLDVGWIINYTTLYEQSFSAGLGTILNFNGLNIRVPWATSKFMKPVRPLRLKS